MKPKLQRRPLCKKPPFKACLLATFIFFASLNTFALESDYLLFQNTRITIEEDRVLSVVEAFQIIQEQTAYTFVFPANAFKGVPTFTMEKEIVSPEELLQKSLGPTDYTYEVTDMGAILLKLKPQENPLQTQSEQFSVSGTVTDSNGMPLPGVNVQEEGTSNGVVTDFDGNFSIEVSSEESILTFTYLGMTTVSRTVGDNTSITVQLQDDLESLDEVVITALGIERAEKSLGYSTSNVDTDELTAGRTTNVGNSLVGKVAGLNVSPPATGPGGTAKIRIRGQSSFGGNNSPLIIVNGVPINNDMGGAANSAGDGFSGEARTDTGDGLQSINPDDIESLNVLKGAAAAALYGFRAKDGAIIITTKSGKRQEGIGIDISSSVQFDRALDFTDFQ